MIGTPETPEEKAAAKLFSGRVDFLLSAPQLKFLPDPTVPEIAFCGRSNVGKSSLLNALTGRKSIARASVTPGRTQELNIFEAGEPTLFRLVDMPGYGYAKAPKTEIAKWTALTRDFLRGRATLRRIFLLVDSRHGLKESDREIMSMLDDVAVTYQVVLTKIDKIKTPEVKTILEKTQTAIARRPAAFPVIITTSSVKKTGLDMLKAEIAALALPDDRL